MWEALRRHYPEYVMEAAGLGFFMISAALCTILLEHPGSHFHAAIADPVTRRVMIGIAMGVTAIGIIYS
ncbi:MAG: aquaporin family protein, partial [Nitrospiraceae bacterium]